ncbi:MAG: hypothetical protein ACK4WF_03585 [Candidatus Brocadiales bacterium]
MRVRDHVVLGGIFSLGLLPLLGIKSLAFWAASVLIDADHYIEFLYHNGFNNFSLKEANSYHRVLSGWLSRPEFINLSIFHTMECLLLVYFLSYWLGSPWLVAIFYGMLVHLFLDAVHLYSLGVPFKRAFSIVEFKIRKGIMERNGLYPKVLYKEALNLTWQGTKN